MSAAGPTDALLARVEARDRTGFVDAVRGVARTDGLAGAMALLADLQREVGMRWQSHRWSVAEEHAATAMVDQALSAAAAEAPVTPRHPGHVVVTCGEDEWHVLPARMFAEHLRLEGWDTIFLGGSLPGAHLERYFERNRPIAAAISCSVPIQLPGARRTVESCHTADIPAMVGGAAVGAAGHRAQAIGADAWASDAAQASRVLEGWAAETPVLARPTVDDAAADQLAAARPVLVEAAMRALGERFPPMLEYSRGQLARTREDFDFILQFVGAALLTDDPTVLFDFTAWLAEVLDARGLPPGIVPLSLETLEGVLPEEHADARRLLAGARDPRPGR